MSCDIHKCIDRHHCDWSRLFSHFYQFLKSDVRLRGRSLLRSRNLLFISTHLLCMGKCHCWLQVSSLYWIGFYQTRNCYLCVVKLLDPNWRPEILGYFPIWYVHCTNQWVHTGQIIQLLQKVWKCKYYQFIVKNKTANYLKVYLPTFYSIAVVMPTVHIWNKKVYSMILSFFLIVHQSVFRHSTFMIWSWWMSQTIDSYFSPLKLKWEISSKYRRNDLKGEIWFSLDKHNYQVFA